MVSVTDVDNSNMNINETVSLNFLLQQHLPHGCNEQCDNTTVLVYHNGMISSSGVISGICRS